MNAPTIKPLSLTEIARRYTASFKAAIEHLPQQDLVLVFCAALSALDDEHLGYGLQQIDDNDLGTVVALGIREQRAREQANDGPEPWDNRSYTRKETKEHLP